MQGSKTRAKLKAETGGHTAKSYRQLGKKYKVDKKTLKKYLRDMDIVKLKRKTVPAITEKQEGVIVKRLRHLSQDLFSAKSNNICVMDDESYFTVEGNEWCPKFYFKLPGVDVPDKVKYNTKTKFPGKVLLWMAISERGVSDPVFIKAGLAVNADVYIEKCLPALK